METLQKLIAGESGRKAGLARSKFRSSFKLSSEDLAYIEKNGIEKIRSHARDFLLKRLAPSDLPNDGKQTPFRGHPVFKAQHATATCCRSCLSKWYDLPRNRELTASEIDYLVTVTVEWIQARIKT